MVTEYTQGGDASTTIGNLGGTANTRPSSSLPGSAALCQHTLAGGTSNGNGGGSGPVRTIILTPVVPMVAAPVPMVTPMVIPTPATQVGMTTTVEIKDVQVVALILKIQAQICVI